MIFRTEYKGDKYMDRGGVVLSVEKPVVAVGSCFAENVCVKMRESLWDARNPLGTLFNPLSIAKILGLLLKGDDADAEIERSLFETRGVWHSWLFDSKFSSLSKDALRLNLLSAIDSFREALDNSGTLIVTFGTARCYALDGGYVVANCHKMPSNLFTVNRVTVDAIVSEWNLLISALRDRFPELQIIFTVSPVRHIKDGFVENMRSKATLILAVEELVKSHGSCCYFPAFEILNDDLRDYRFYAGDLVHPSSEGIEYIWEKFRETFISAEDECVLKEGNSIWKRVNHRPIVSGTPEAIEFAEKTKNLVKGFSTRHPGMIKNLNEP